MGRGSTGRYHPVLVLARGVPGGNKGTVLLLLPPTSRPPATAQEVRQCLDYGFSFREVS